MAYFPASCDYKCKDCSQNKCGWCAFLDRPTISGAIAIPANQSVNINSYSYSEIIGNEEDEK